ncbi:UDP-glycosyltransferase UGT5-like isoform X1 [Rhodnius prolixus]
MLLYSFILILFLLTLCFGANILIMSTVPSLSHSIWNQRLAKLIADRNHQVTVLDSFPSKIFHPNITHHELGIAFDFQKFDMKKYSLQSSPWFHIDLTFYLVHKSCEQQLTSPMAKKFLDAYKDKNKPFDLIIWDAACCESFLGFLVKFGSPPLVSATPAISSLQLMNYAGNYDNPSYVPLSFSLFTSHMNFWERVENTLLYLYQIKTFYFSHIPNENQLAKRIFGSETPNVEELAKRSLVTLVGSHPVIEGVKPLLPSTVSIAGFQIDKPKPLEKELQSFLDSATDGAIYFSFGTNLLCEYLEQEELDIFIRVFKEIKQKVLWKCGMDIPNLPKNVRLGKWFNQSDVLAHPNVKVFISHSGLLGTQEALYHGVPVLAFSFIIDQHFIAQKLEKMGLGIHLIYADLTVSTLKNALQRLLTEPSFQVAMKERSAIFRDTPIPPRDLAIYWIEHALRHPRTNLLRSPVQNMSFYHVLLLDVIAFFVVIIAAVITLLVLLAKCSLKLFCKRSKLKSH